MPADLLAAIVNSSDDAIIGKTTDGMITTWNPAAEHMYGYTAEEIIGQPITVLCPPDRVAEIQEILSRSAAASASLTARPSGSAKTGRSSRSP